MLVVYTVDLRELWKYCSDANQIYTRSSLIIAAVNEYIGL